MKVKKILLNSGSTLLESVVSMAIIGISAAMIAAGIIAGTNFVHKGADFENNFNASRVALENKISTTNGSGISVTINGNAVSGFRKISDDTAGIDLVYYKYNSVS